MAPVPPIVPQIVLPMPPSYDGTTRFGVWPIPGRRGWQTLVVGSDPSGRWIEAALGNRIVLTMSRPSADCPSVVSAPVRVNDHEIVLYSETRTGGWSVLCDVFVDGFSLTTGEPIGVIQLRAEASRERLRKGRFAPYLSGFQPMDFVVAVFFSWVEMTVVGREARSAVGLALAAALVVAANIPVGRGWRVAFGWLRNSGWGQPKSGAAAIGITLGFSLSALPVAVLALLLARIG